MLWVKPVNSYPRLDVIWMLQEWFPVRYVHALSWECITFHGLKPPDTLDSPLDFWSTWRQILGLLITPWLLIHVRTDGSLSFSGLFPFGKRCWVFGFLSFPSFLASCPYSLTWHLIKSLSMYHLFSSFESGVPLTSGYSVSHYPCSSKDQHIILRSRKEMAVVSYL